MKEIVGIIMLVLLFSALFVICARDIGLKRASLTFGLATLMVIWLFGAVTLIMGG